MVTLYSAIVKFILAMQLQLTKPQRNHLLHIMQGIILCEGRKTITQIRSSAGSYRHLSCMTKFLKHSPWCVNRMQKRRMQFLLERIRRKHSKKGDTRTIVFLIIDDTSCKKDVSTKHIEALDFHFSHDEKKGVWSHCLVTAHIVTKGYSFAWDLRPYFRKEYCHSNQIPFKSKNDLALELIQSYEAADDELVYVLMDSWYTSKKIIDTCNTKGFHSIAAVKTNRKICPAGIRIKITDFAANHIHKSDLRSVTVENQKTYKVYE